MSTKAKATSSKATSKTAPKAAAKISKETKGKAPEAIVPVTLEGSEEGDADDMDSDDLEGGNTSSSGGAEAALAALTASTEATGSLKNFRHHPDMENFYRFIYENDLRIEAVKIIDEMMSQRELQKNVRVAKSKAH
jgi:hypothetical protein